MIDSGLFEVVMQLAKEVFDRNSFWNLVLNIFKNNKKFVSSVQVNQFLQKVEDEDELLVSFLTFLVVFHNMKKQKKSNIMDLFGSKVEFENQKQVNRSQDVIFEEKENYFEQLIAS